MGKIRKVALLCVWMLVVMLVGCSPTSSKTTTSGLEEEQAINYEELSLDNYGRKVVFNQKPKKVLTFGPNCTELFIALGLSDYIIGNSLDNHSRGALPEYKEDYARIPELTYGSATREAVITSGADFIYGIDWQFGGDGLDVKELESFGITSYINSASTLDEIFQEILDIGKIFQIEEVAAAYVVDQKARIAKIQEEISGQDAVKVLIYDSGGDGVFTAGGTNFETLLLEYAGGKNIFDDIVDKQWITVSYEEVLARKPDVIVIHDYDSPSLEQKIKDIKNDPALSQLECVKNDQFISIPLESVLPGNRMAHTIESLANGLKDGSLASLNKK
ncbi:ABC transporter substrate-binding protein [Bacillus sp. S/N-304-OC-R1]|uniref:ABC transporter substrate-binding protein n=1 Tax=Bacillus sp. S/N-304-OC-R1 TaxID=2758034 RepID=UPI001C8DEFBA|nr:ABC transporter substrate-binding protein [Bacillus sp. S/N-304-OC-R1]MBY0122891.1 ABC transporter substrate-binding protein [Bacillus sp. S/N-304-OC-R1]